MEFLAQYWVLIVAVILVAIVAYGTVAKTAWGINFARVSCPNCGEPAPTIRRPSSGSQAAWGGHVCEKCGTGFDKWGRQTSPPTKPVV